MNSFINKCLNLQHHNRGAYSSSFKFKRRSLNGTKNTRWLRLSLKSYSGKSTVSLLQVFCALSILLLGVCKIRFQCRRQGYIQWKDKTPEDPSIPSIFNCHSSHGRCQYFRPAHFFHSCGQGHEFASILREMQQEHLEGRLWRGMPPILMPYLRLNTNMQMKSGKYFDRHNLSFIHVHKCGGSSIYLAFRDIEIKNEQSLQIKDDYKGTYFLYSQMRDITMNSKGWNESKAFLENAVTYQKPNDWDESNHMIMAVVRDPVERFISAVGQVSSEKFQSGKKLRNICIKSTARDTLQCFVDLVKEKGYWIDLHFTPMVLEISFATMGKDVPVAIFPFSALPDILSSLGANPKRKKKDGKKAGYRSPVLVNVTTHDLGPTGLFDICNLYKMDVILLRSLGYPSHCDLFNF